MRPVERMTQLEWEQFNTPKVKDGRPASLTMQTEQEIKTMLSKFKLGDKGRIPLDEYEDPDEIKTWFKYVAKQIGKPLIFTRKREKGQLVFEVREMDKEEEDRIRKAIEANKEKARAKNGS